MENSEISFDLRHFGEAAAGKTISTQFGGDVLVFEDTSLPGGYALCMAGMRLHQANAQGLPIGYQFEFSPIRADGLVENQLKEYRLDEKTRLVRRAEMGALPPILMSHTATAEKSTLISKLGLYTAGQAIIKPLKQWDDRYSGHFNYHRVRLLGRDVVFEEYMGYPPHQRAILFRVAPSSLSPYFLTDGVPDGLAIYSNPVPVAEIPEEVIRLASGRSEGSLSAQKLAKLAEEAQLAYKGASYHLPPKAVIDIQEIAG